MYADFEDSFSVLQYLEIGVKSLPQCGPQENASEWDAVALHSDYTALDALVR